MIAAQPALAADGCPKEDLRPRNRSGALFSEKGTKTYASELRTSG
jgi:hypothetical protein